jgi:hypothetical protein
VQLGDQHDVHLRDWVDVVEGKQLTVIIHLSARDFTANYLAKNAVIHSFLLNLTPTPDDVNQ